MHNKYRRQDRDPGWVGHNVSTSTRKTWQLKPYIVAEVPQIKFLYLMIDSIEVHVLDIHICT